MRRFMAVIIASTLSGSALSGCEWIDAATADKPSERQMDALGDAFGAIGAFAAVTNDPASADTSDLADMHATEPYQIILDPDAPAARRAPVENVALGECVRKQGSTTTWDCPFTLGALSCRARGSGTKNSDGTYSGDSTETCTGTTRTAKVIARNVVFDKTSGQGGGILEVQVGNPTLGGWAIVTIEGLGFCLEKSPPLPKRGRVTVDGQGLLDGAPEDPFRIKFTDTPVCGTALIE